jgi:rRNA small subunit pseudouridine methyltransferase Nep1
VQLLQLHSIRGNNGPDKLLKCIKGPVTNYLPTKCIKLSEFLGVAIVVCPK